MTPQSCQAATEGVANGIAAALQGVDCVASNMTGQAFGRLFRCATCDEEVRVDLDHDERTPA